LSLGYETVALARLGVIRQSRTLVNLVKIPSSQRHSRDFAGAELKCREWSILLRLAPPMRGRISICKVAPERIMAKPKNEKHKNYARYAARCLEMTGAKSHQDDRAILREMTAEWLRLADAIAHPLKPKAQRAQGRARAQPYAM
jgi:hypothetical protein